MDVSPFPYQGPLDPAQVRGREALIADLTERITERRVTALLGPRRYGKTSIVRRVVEDLSDESSIIWIDLYEVASLADLAVRLDDALVQTRGAVRAALARVAASVSLNLGVARLEFRKQPSQQPDALATVHTLLDVMVKGALRSPTAIVFDEFSSIANVANAAGLLRTYLQHHYQSIGLVFAGSEPAMMRMLFSDVAQPFYAQADLVEIGPMTEAEVATIVLDGFDETGRAAGPVASRVAAFSRGHPQRAMHLADAAWRRTAPGEEADDDVWAAALEAVRRDTDAGLERLYSALNEGQRASLRILAAGGSLFGADARLLDLSPGAAQHARKVLVDRGHVHDVDGRFEIVDPLFADWINRRFAI